MLMVALIMRPWVMKSKQNGGAPSVLADDILLLTTGPKMLTTFATILRDTDQFSVDIGATISHDKIFNFKTCDKAKRSFETVHWSVINAPNKGCKEFAIPWHAHHDFRQEVRPND